MSKKNLYLLLSCGFLTSLLLLGTFIKINSNPNPIIVNSLSPRAEEFIATQRQSGTGFWSYQQLASPDTTLEKLEAKDIATDCFAFRLPWNYRSELLTMTENRCTWSAKTVVPLSHLLISSYKMSNLDEDSGVQLRRLEKETYRETQLRSTYFTQAILFRSNSALIVFAQLEKIGVTIALNELSPSASISDQELTKILDSFTIMTDITVAQ